MSGFVLAIDQGTTSTRAIVFDDGFRIVGIGQQEFPQHFSHSGWVEHDPEDIWRSTVATIRTALADASLSASDIAAVGITNQRETTLVWDRETGAAIHNAIVWQDRRTSELCRRLVAEGHEPDVTAKTGLVIDPYFPAPSSPGSSTMSKARAPRPRPAGLPSAPSTASCSGASPAARSTRRMPPTPPAPCSSTSRPIAGTTTC